MKADQKQQFPGLSDSEVVSRKEAGLVNKVVKPVSPSRVWIILRNSFNLINIFLFPLVLALLYFERYQEVFAISTFAIINSALSTWDELRIKRRLDQIQVKFAPHITVVRNSKAQDISTEELVEDDIVIVNEGEGIPTDGTTLISNNLLIDESILTGESDYIPKDKGDRLLGGSFVVTGRVTYRVAGLGNGTYINDLSAQARTYKREKSTLQKTGDKLTIFFVSSAVIFGLITFYSAYSLGLPVSEAVVPLVTAVALIVPQTLIFLFTFSLSIAVVKLSNLGALVQRGGSIETLAKLDVLCLDKTGTITKNTMQVTDVRYWNLDKHTIGSYLNYAEDKVFGKNKTFESLVAYYSNIPAINGNEFDQIPFTSRTKVSKHQFRENGQFVTMVYGAIDVVKEFLAPELVSEVTAHIKQTESQGLRVLVGVVSYADQKRSLDSRFSSKKVWVVALREELNPGISDILKQFREVDTTLKVITGDSLTSVTRVLEALEIDLGKTLDLSNFKGDLGAVVKDYNIFARAKPEHKLEIVKSLQAGAQTVGMIGDGVNDVLAMKSANVSIAMESGARITRDVADIVLLKNDFSLMPKIIFEGNNVVYNLKFITTVFMAKTFHAMIFLGITATSRIVFPILPVSTLVYGFMGTSLPSYVISFYRSNVPHQGSFLRRVLPDSLISAAVGAAASIFITNYFGELDARSLNTAIIYGALVFSNLFAMSQLLRSGYLPNVFVALAAAAIINVIAASASVIPFIKDYYFLSPLSLTTWGDLLFISISGFGIYLVLQTIWDKLIKVRFSYFQELPA